MIARALYRWTARLPCRLILRGGEVPYLERYYLGRFCGLTFYLHRFVDDDGDEAVHDHPWRACAWCLSGGYVEERVWYAGHIHGPVCRRRRRHPGSIIALGRYSFHRIVRVNPETWTLFVHGRRRKIWGFVEKEDQGKPIYSQQFPVSDPEWWLRAPLGRDAGREPLCGRTPAHAHQSDHAEPGDS